MNIVQKLTIAMSRIGAIAKTQRNAQQGYSFRGIDDVMQAVQPEFAELGILPTPEVLEEQREERTTKSGTNLIYTILKVKYTFHGGEEEPKTVSAIMVGEGMDSGDKSSNKAMSAAFKYALLQVLCVPTEEAKDADCTSPEPSVPLRKANMSVNPPKKTTSLYNGLLAWIPENAKINMADVKTLNLVRRANALEPIPSFSGSLRDLYAKFIESVSINGNGQTCPPDTVQGIVDAVRAAGSITGWANDAIAQIPDNCTLIEHILNAKD